LKRCFHSTLLPAIWIAFGASVVGIAVNATAPRGIPLVTPPLPQSAKPLKFEQVAPLFDDKKAVFVDARPLGEYESGHIQGAIAFPYDKRETYLPKLRSQVPSNTHLIVYCDSAEECDLSKKLSGYLLQQGWKRVNYYEDGYNKWANDMAMPITQGPNP